MKGFGKKKIEKIVSILKDVERAGAMEDASFDGSPEGELPKTEKEVTIFIRNRTRMYRDTWITEPLERVITSLEKVSKGEVDE